MRKLPIICLALAVGMTAGTGIADDDHEEALRLREQAEILPLEQILQRLGLGPDARILEIETEIEHGRYLYEIEYLTADGRVYEALVDARSGEILEQDED